MFSKIQQQSNLFEKIQSCFLCRLSGVFFYLEVHMWRSQPPLSFSLFLFRRTTSVCEGTRETHHRWDGESGGHSLPGQRWDTWPLILMSFSQRQVISLSLLKLRKASSANQNTMFNRQLYETQFLINWTLPWAELLNKVVWIADSSTKLSQSKRNEGFGWKHSRIFLHSYNERQWTPTVSRSKWVSVQLQRALNDTRWWMRVLSSQTIAHFKNK